MECDLVITIFIIIIAKRWLSIASQAVNTKLTASVFVRSYVNSKLVTCFDIALRVDTIIPWNVKF